MADAASKEDEGPKVLSDADLDRLARTVYAEMAPGATADAAMIAHVVRNRMVDNTRPAQWGDTIAKNTRGSQFSANLPSQNNPRVDVAAGDPEFERVKSIVQDVYAGLIPDSTKGMTHYYSDKARGGAIDEPYWWGPEVANAKGAIYEVPGSPHRVSGQIVPVASLLENPTSEGAIRALQSLLAQAELVSGPPTGVMDPVTTAAKSVYDRFGTMEALASYGDRVMGAPAPPQAKPDWDTSVAQAVQNVMGAGAPAARSSAPTSIEDIIAAQGSGLPTGGGSALDMSVARALESAMGRGAAPAPEQRDERKVSFDPAGTVDREPNRFDAATTYATQSGMPADLAVAAATLAGRSPDDTFSMLSGADRQARAAGIDLGQVSARTGGMPGDITLSQAIERAAGPLAAVFASDRVNEAKSAATSAFGPNTTVDALTMALDRANAQLGSARPPESSMITAPIDPPRAETVAAAFSPSARSEAGHGTGAPMSVPTGSYDPVTDWSSRVSRTTPQAGSGRVVGQTGPTNSRTYAPVSTQTGPTNARGPAAPISSAVAPPGSTEAKRLASVYGQYGQSRIAAETLKNAPVPGKKPAAPAAPPARTVTAPKVIAPPAPPPPPSGTRENPISSAQANAQTPGGSFVSSPAGVGRTMGAGAGSAVAASGRPVLTGTYGSGSGEQAIADFVNAMNADSGAGDSGGTVVCTWLYGLGEVSRTDWKRMQIHGARDVDLRCLLGYRRLFSGFVDAADRQAVVAAVLRYLFWLYAEGIIRPRRRPVTRAVVCGVLGVICRVAAPRRVQLRFPAT